jgi:hypothetical protein
MSLVWELKIMVLHKPIVLPRSQRIMDWHIFRKLLMESLVFKKKIVQVDHLEHQSIPRESSAEDVLFQYLQRNRKSNAGIDE